MVYFSLRTNDEQEIKNANKVIRELKKTFGKENVSTNNYEMWKSVEIDNANACIGVKDWGFNNANRLHIYNFDDKKKNYDVPLEWCDTIYNM